MRFGHPLLKSLFSEALRQTATGSCAFADFFAAAVEASTMVIAFLGHRGSHIPQPMHFSWLTTWTWRTSPEMAFTGQTFSHISMPTHLAGSMKAFGLTGI